MSQDLQGASMATVGLVVNGEMRRVDVAARRTLADVLRDDLGLTGTHLGCEHGVCGACTVLVDGRSVRACIMLALQAEGREVTTIEGLSPCEGMSPLQRAMSEHGGLQCGFCTPGFVVAATELLRDNPDVDEAGVRSALSGNLCRCTGYEGIVDAVLSQRGVDLDAPQALTGLLVEEHTTRPRESVGDRAGGPAHLAVEVEEDASRHHWTMLGLVLAALAGVMFEWRRRLHKET